MIPIPPETLRILYQMRQANDVHDDLDEWRSNLSPEKAFFWRNLRSIPLAASGVEGAVKSFHYDRERFNPFQIERNFSTAVKLLEDCFAIRDAADDLEISIAEEQAAWDLSEKLEEWAAREDEVITSAASSIGRAQELVTLTTPGSPSSHTRAVSNMGDEDPLEVQIARARRQITKANRDRIRTAAGTVGSAYHRRARLERSRARYVDRVTDLVMLVEALRHGLLVVHGIKPIAAKCSQEALATSREAFDKYTELDDSRIHPARLSPDDDMRTVLWSMGKELQRLSQSVDDYVDQISIRKDCFFKSDQKFDRNLLQIARDDPREEKNLWRQALKTGVLEFRVPPGRFVEAENTRLIGLSAQVILWDLRKLTKLNDNKVGELVIVEYLTEHLMGSAVTIAVTPPRQALDARPEGNQLLHPGRSITLNSPAAVQARSMLTGMSSPTMYGEGIVENFDPSRPFWRVELRKGAPADVDYIDDVYLYLHLKRWSVEGHP